MVEEAVKSAGSQSGLSRRTVMKGAAWTVPALMVATAAPAYALSCQPGTYSGIGRGKFLTGGLFNQDLDTLASVNGVIASAPTYVSEPGLVHDGASGTSHTGQNGLNPDTHGGPLDLTLLSTVNLTATGVATTLSALLAGLVDADTGAVNQFGSVTSGASTSVSLGASGAVTDAGVVDLEAAGGSYPDVASINLKTLLTPLLGGPTAAQLADIADLQLKVGAVAGRASLDYVDCPPQLGRDYAVAHLLLELNSGLVSGLTAAIVPLLNAILNDPLLNLLLPVRLVPGIITNGYDSQNPIAAANPPKPLPEAGPIRANLATGDVVVDLAVLLGGTSASPFGSGYQPWLSQREPNSILFVDYPIPSGTITTFLNDLVTGITDRIFKAVQIDVAIVGTDWKPLDDAGLAGEAVATVLTPLINVLLAPGGAIYLLLSAISDLLATVFDLLKNVLNVMLNVQNAPEENNNPATGPGWRPAPARFTSKAAFTAERFDVAALGLHAVNAPANQNDVVDLYLARGSVGRSQLLSTP